MRRASNISLMLLLGWALLPRQPASALGSENGGQKATLKTASATTADIPFDTADHSAEQKLLELVNQSRQKSGAPALTFDSGLARAARIHAQAMLDAAQLSHQFDGEPPLMQRLVATTNLQLDQAGENVAFDYDAEGGHEHLMLSAPHRANLLNPAYNVVGLGVVRSGDRLYIVEDFGHALPSYSVDDVKEDIAAAVSDLRRQARRPELQRVDQLVVHDAACSMAQADKLGTDAVRKLAARSTILSYTSLHPEALPSGTDAAIAGQGLQTLSIGACYARTPSYPTGVYWIVLALK